MNYCLRALIDKGFVKACNFKHLLTPKDIEEKTILTASFLQCKIAKHDNIIGEIERLKYDVQ